MNLQLLVCFPLQECSVDRFRHQQCEAHNTDSTKYRPHFLGGNNIKFAWETLFDIAIDNSYFATENSGKPGTELTLLNPARPFYMEEIPRLSVAPN